MSLAKYRKIYKDGKKPVKINNDFNYKQKSFNLKKEN
jgi:hypothetical protein